MNKNAPITAIILAAGLSSRMKGENKMLLPFKETTILQTTYDQVKASAVDEVVIVDGNFYQRIVNLIKIDFKDKVVQNHKPEMGMTSSIQAGVKMVKENAFMICLGDMPTLSTAHYDALIGCFLEASEKDESVITVPNVNGQQGNPVIFSQSYREDILLNVEPNGCKAVIELNKSHLVPLNTDNSHYLSDIDTPEDYDQFINEPQ
jgi:molybdenum cofactor cytidylyltransferase